MQPVISQDELWRLLQEERIETHFHPITSIRRQSVVGLEALSRGQAEFPTQSQSRLIAPSELFGAARAYGMELELDRVCRRVAVRSFAPIHRAHPLWILFLNFHTRALIEDLDSEHSILKLAEDAGIDPRNVAVEVLETEIKDASALQKAVLAHRELGFLVALDDIGAGHANLDRIAFVKPDLIKADVGLVRGLDRDYHRQEVFKSLVHLSERIGGWLVAEGVETPGEAQAALDLGADILQGFLFARPQLPHEDGVDAGLDCVEEVAHEFKKRVLGTMTLRREQKCARLQVLEAATELLRQSPEQEMESRLRDVARRFEIVDSLSVLDADGVQVTNSVLATIETPNKSVIFQPPIKGTDHSMKEYVYALREGGCETFETPPYVPLPCGKLSVTLSTFFGDVEGHRRILVAHLVLPGVESDLQATLPLPVSP